MWMYFGQEFDSPHLHHFGDSPLRGGFDTKKARGGFEAAEKAVIL